MEYRLVLESGYDVATVNQVVEALEAKDVSIDAIVRDTIWVSTGLHFANFERIVKSIEYAISLDIEIWSVYP